MPYHRTYGSVWNGAAPTGDPEDTATVVLAMRLRALQDGWVVGAKYLRNLANNGEHFAMLWNIEANQLLRLQLFPWHDAEGSGPGNWEHCYFHKRLRLLEGEACTVAVWFQHGGYYRELGALSAGPMVGDGVEFVEDGELGSNGLYQYLNNLTPFYTFDSSAYGVDVLFQKDVI
jgi:hypothetical protein